MEITKFKNDYGFTTLTITPVWLLNFLLKEDLLNETFYSEYRGLNVGAWAPLATFLRSRVGERKLAKCFNPTNKTWYNDECNKPNKLIESILQGGSIPGYATLGKIAKTYNLDFDLLWLMATLSKTK